MARSQRASTSQDATSGRLMPLALSALALLVILFGAMFAYPLAWSNEVLPGVSVAGIELGGMSEAEAATALRSELPGAAPTIEIRDIEDDRAFSVSPEALGLPWSAERLAAMALEAGRGPWPWQPLLTRLRGLDLASDLRLDEARATQGLAALAPEVDIPPRNAAVEVVDGRLQETEAMLGRQLDMAKTLERLREAAPHPELVPIYFSSGRTSPRVYSDEGVAEAYRLATEKPLTMRWTDGRTWTVPTDTLRSWFSIEQQTNEQGDRQPFVTVDRGAVERWVEPLAAELVQEPRDARFSWSAQGVTVRLAEQPGLRLDVAATVDRVIEAAYWEGRVLDPVVNIERPLVTRNAEGGLQGMRDLGRGATSLVGLPAEHITVLAAATERLDGVVVPGRSVYSFRKALGSVEGDPSFAALGAADAAFPDEAGMLSGMDQMATTAFRAALWTGMRIVERHAPARRSGWLEPPIGLDAVVDAEGGARDLAWENDTGLPMLVAVELDAARGTLLWTIYGTPPLRQVQLAGPIVSGLSPPGAAVDLPTTLIAPGTARQVAWAREGATVQVARTVRDADGAVLLQDVFDSVYAATGDTVLRGATP